MSIRIRLIDGTLVALCAARSVEKPGDTYLDDAQHHALAEKFAEDFASEGYNTYPHDGVAVVLRAREESDNPNREEWDRWSFGAEGQQSCIKVEAYPIPQVIQRSIEDSLRIARKKGGSDDRL